MTGWPEGLYGLPMALTGCSANSTINWKTGTLHQDCEDTDPQTSHTFQFHLNAVVNRLGDVERSFCMKTSTVNDSYRSKWPSGNNVMQVLYLANKYMVPSLAEKCTAYLRDHLKASNVFCILPHAQKFEDKDLKDRCWEVIEMQTEETVTSDEFVTVERSVVESVVKREKLNVKEVELFKAVDRWATKESERQRLTPEGDVKRRILGEEIVKAIRFPLMSLKEFASVVIDSNILTLKEAGDMMKHYGDVLTSSLPFIHEPRIGCARYRCHRFGKICLPDSNWHYRDSKRDSVQFSVSKPVTLFGVQLFGSRSGEYTVVTEVKDSADDSAIVKQSGSYASENHKSENNQYYGFDVQFDRPVNLQENKKYKLVSLIEGPNSWYGDEGRASVECKGGVRFTFTSSDVDSNGTSVRGGQFPAFIFA
ncbi:BTB/POZ domain-containing protein 6-like [Orbicella faveolata]|uniref:BTB/POZ domain-containing protein 6-like n=1 Tax=Orbicella faveolata TaxID=48498 RepID=UPI0009E2C339|nr:BTB/POZ domain-containing protein 6-like [Orbicella faveolata]